MKNGALKVNSGVVKVRIIVMQLISYAVTATMFASVTIGFWLTTSGVKMNVTVTRCYWLTVSSNAK